ncbi:MAG: hypothetical protein ACO3A2_04605 [Bdellovibrionia bacterium]
MTQAPIWKKNNRPHCWLFFLVLIPSLASADPSQEFYEKSLMAVQKKLFERTQSLHRTQALTDSPRSFFVPQSYQLGDQWDVATWSYQRTEMRKTQEESSRAQSLGTPQILHYRVTQVKNTKTPEIEIQVLSSRVDPKSPDFSPHQTPSSTLKWTMMLSPQGEIQGTSQISSPQTNSPLGATSTLLRPPFELHSLIFPQTLHAEIHTTEIRIPTLPQPVLAFARQQKMDLDFSDCIEFEQEDFYGRPMKILWKKGDPWPSYFETSSGISILIRKENP